MFARKRVLRGRGSEQSQRYLIKELQELRRLDHQHLVQIIGSYTDTEYIAYLMKPVAQGTLEEFLSGPQQLRNSDKVILRRFYGCLAGAMDYLYIHRVRHRDLTARNILIDSAGEIYISDFGSAYNWASKPSSKTKHRNIPTSPDYMAPEISKGDERGTRSDMWSLGVVFLEMTTKLLNHRPAELKKRIRSNAERTRVQPYPYANIPIIISWMETLGQTSTDYDHDREPLGWARELLHAEHEHRPTPPQLMRYIRESPSFGVFSCLKCEGEFLDDAFAYGPTALRIDSREVSQQTREAVEALFSNDSSKPAFSSMPSGRTDSIEKWIEDSNQPEKSFAELPALKFTDDAWDVGDIDATNAMHTQCLYNTYEYEFYHPTHFVHSLMEPPRGSGLLPSLSLTEPIELLGDTTWAHEIPESPSAKSKPKMEEKPLVDSGLGFLEYMSNSSEDDKLLQPFEEISDRSSVQSDESSHIRALYDPLDTMFKEDEFIKKGREMPIGPHESNELLFDEEEDKSEVENPWEEASDRSEPENESQIDGLGVVGMESHVVKSAEAAETTEQLPEQAPDLIYPLTGTEPELTFLQDGSKDVEKENISEPPPQDSHDSSPIAEDQQEEEEIPVPNQSDIKQGEKEYRESNLAPDISVKKRRKKTRFAEPVEYIKEVLTDFDNGERGATVPDIFIHSTGNAQPESSKLPNKGASRPLKLSMDNIRNLDKGRPPPVTPRKRDALVPVDIRKLMDNTWEMASSAPSLTVSEDTKSKLRKFFFMIPSDAQIESLLSNACRKGSAGVVKTILQKSVSGTKPLKYRQYFIPLLYAVQGASSRHNKCVRELLAAGVDPDHKSKKTGLTPLHIAVAHPNFKGYTKLIWLLLSSKKKADPNSRDRDGELPLTKLFVGADTTPLEPHKRGALAMLLKEGAEPNFTLPGTGSTPLHLAVRRQDKITVAMLLHMGANVDAKNMSGTTPLQMTANQFRGELGADHAEVLEHLLQYGARVDERAGVLGRTALHWATIAGCAQAVARLLEAGANPRLRDNEAHDTVGLAIQHAEKLTADKDREKLADHVEIMLGLTKASNYGWKLEEGTCAVETACCREDGGDMLRELLRGGLSPRAKYRQGTILEFARRDGGDVAKRLLEFDVGIPRKTRARLPINFRRSTGYN